MVENPADLPNPTLIDKISEPWIRAAILAPNDVVGPIMELMAERRAEYKKMEYIQTGAGSVGGTARVIIEVVAEHAFGLAGKAAAGTGAEAHAGQGLP